MKILNIKESTSLNGFIVSFEEFINPSWFKRWFFGAKVERKEYRLFTNVGIVWWTLPSFNQCNFDGWRQKEQMFNSYRMKRAYKNEKND